MFRFFPLLCLSVTCIKILKGFPYQTRHKIKKLVRMTRHKRHSGNDDERRWVDDIIFSHIGFVHGTAGLLLYSRGGVSCTFIASLPLYCWLLRATGCRCAIFDSIKYSLFVQVTFIEKDFKFIFQIISYKVFLNLFPDSVMLLRYFCCHHPRLIKRLPFLLS